MAFDGGCESLAGRLELIGLDADARARLATTVKAMDVAAPALIEQLFEHLRAFPETAQRFHDVEQVERLARLQRRHVVLLLEGDTVSRPDEERKRIGTAHDRLGISPQMYFGACSLIVRSQVRHVLAGCPDSVAALDTAGALIGMALLEAGTVLDACGLHAEASVRVAALPPDDVEWRCRFLQIDATAKARLRELAPILEAAMPDVLTDFSRAITAHLQIPAAMMPATVARLTSASETFWHELSAGRFDRFHATSRGRAGLVHERTGVSLPLCLAGLARQFGHVVRAMPAEHPDLVDLVDALVRAVFFDVTCVVDAYAQARAERLLLAEGHAEELVARMVDAVVVVDEHNCIESANEQLLPFARVDPGALRRMPIGDALAIPEIVGLIEHVRTSLEDRHSMLTRLGGRIQRITAIRLDSRDDPGSGAVALVLSDVTELIRSAEAARESRMRLDHLIGSVSAVVWEFDLASDVVRYISTPVLEMTGYPDTHFLGRPGGWQGAVHPLDEVRLVRVLAGLQAGDTAALEHRLVHADGHDVLVRTHVRRVDAPVPTIIGVTVDVGELQAERLNQERAIGNLAGGVAHELSNALSAIYGHLAVLGRLVHDPRAQRSLAAAEGAAARAADITARLLSFAGRQVLEVDTMHLNDVVREVVPVGSWPTGRVQVEHHLEGALAPCRVDRERVAAALGELVVNAFEAMPHGGVLRVSTANVVGADGTEQVEVAVADAGRGMSAEELARAIEPFYTTKPLDRGAGLGLSTVYGFVTQSGGTLLLDSVEGAGTVVRMRFPGERRGAIEETIAIGAPAPTGHVLLVDVDPMMREVTSQILSMLGLAVTTADSVGAARQAIDAGEFDFLVTEATLGGHDGLAFVADVLDRRPALGVVVMSGLPAAQLDLGRARGRCERVAKPFSLAAMTRALRNVGWTGPAGPSMP